mmetsp:Transcript_30041/g.73051  ORF Transcript_30041/g.73051 Transcript_30041/m.73051 type:complete len:249 (+) Transcript_30041:34-780(+)
MPRQGGQAGLGTWQRIASRRKPGESRALPVPSVGRQRDGARALIAVSGVTSGSEAGTTTSLAPSTSTTSTVSADTTTTAITSTTTLSTTLTTTSTATPTAAPTTAATTTTTAATTTTTTTTIFGQQTPDAVGLTFFSLAFLAILAVCLCFYAFCHPIIWARRPHVVGHVGRRRLQQTLREEEADSYHALAERSLASNSSSPDPHEAISPSGRLGGSSRSIPRSSTSAPVVERHRVTLEMAERGQSGVS